MVSVLCLQYFRDAFFFEDLYLIPVCNSAFSVKLRYLESSCTSQREPACTYVLNINVDLHNAVTRYMLLALLPLQWLTKFT